MKQLLFWLIILCAFDCQNPTEIDKNEACFKTLRPIVKFGLADSTLMDTTANDIYMLEYTDSWTYSQVAVFEKINKLIKAKTDFSENSKTLRTEREMTDLEWQFVENTVNKTRFWCIDQDSIRPQSVDGRYFTIKAQKGTFKHSLVFEEVSRQFVWVKDTAISDRLQLQAAAHSIFRMTGLNLPHYPFIMSSKKGSKYLLQVASRQMNFEAFLNDKKLDKKEGVAQFEINKSELGNVKLRCIQTEFDGQKVTFEHVIDKDFLKQLPLK